MVYQRTSSDKKFYAGVQGENLAIVVMFPIVGWKDKYGEGTFKGLFSRPGEKAAYYVDITNDDKYVYWSPREEDMYYDGVAQFQLQYEVNDVIAKSVIYKGTIDKGLIITEEPPSPFTNYIVRLDEAISKAEQTILNYPKIDEETNHWYVYDVESGEYIDSEVDARGLPGDKGDTGNSGVALSTEEPTDPDVNVWINEDSDSDYHLLLKSEDGEWHQIPAIKGDQGEPGDQGDPGQDGVSPEVTVEKVGDNAVITVTDAKGTTSVLINAGKDMEASRDNIIEALGYVPADKEYMMDATKHNNVVGTIDATNGHIIPNPNGDMNEAATKQYVNDVHKLDDVTVDGISIVDNGVAKLNYATINDVKDGNNNKIITSAQGVSSVFYNLAKVAGDNTQQSSLNQVGQYTNQAKMKIKEMFGMRKNFKLIQSITLGQATDVIQRTTYSSNYPYQFDEIYVEVTYPAVYQTCNIATQIFVGENQSAVAGGPTLVFPRSTKQYLSFYAKIINGALYFEATESTERSFDFSNIYTGSFMIVQAQSANVDNYISGIKFYGVNDVIYQNTNIKIYAVNA